MGMFDSYHISKDFKCPSCGEPYPKEHDFQSKEGSCIMDSFKLGDILDPSRRYWDWYAYCSRRYRRSDYSKPANAKGEYPDLPAICKAGEFNCRVMLDEKGMAYKEIVSMYDENKEIPIFEATYKEVK